MLVEGHYEILAEKKIETLTLQKIRWKEIVKKEKNWNDVNAVSSVSFIEFILLQIAQRKHHIFLVCLSQDYRFSWIICYLSNYKPVELWPKASDRISIKESSNNTVFIWNRLSGPGLKLSYKYTEVGICHVNQVCCWFPANLLTGTSTTIVLNIELICLHFDQWISLTQ